MYYVHWAGSVVFAEACYTCVCAESLHADAWLLGSSLFLITDNVAIPEKSEQYNRGVCVHNNSNLKEAQRNGGYVSTASREEVDPAGVVGGGFTSFLRTAEEIT